VELADLKQFFDWYHKTKTDDIMKDAASMIVVKNETLTMKSSSVPMYNFYVMGLPQNVPVACEQTLTKSKDLVQRLERVK
jgi:hypothetical protein